MTSDSYSSWVLRWCKCHAGVVIEKNFYYREKHGYS